MAVSVKCDGDASVAQALADDFRMNSAGKKQAGVRVPHIMESHGCQARAPYPAGEPLRKPVGRNRATKRVREDETPVVVFWTHGKPLLKLTVPEPPQRIQRSRAERELVGRWLRSETLAQQELQGGSVPVSYPL